MTAPHIQGFFDEPTNTVSYVVADPATSSAAVIDSVLDYDHSAGRTAHRSAEAIVRFVREQELQVAWILETHIHADHLTAGAHLRTRLRAPVAVGSHITTVQHTFSRLFNLEPGFPADGRQFDRLLDEGDELAIGRLRLRALHTPGHTPACMTYVIGDAAFVGDTLFMPDYGTARVDFPGGDARTLYRSIRRILDLPPETRLFLCHDYKAPGRDEFRWETTVAEQRASNIHVRDGITEDEFVAMRTARDRTLDMPRLILPSIQVNIRAGELPPAESNGVRYLKIPLDAL